MNFLCDKKYLVFPASHHAAKKRLYFYLDGELVYDVVMALDYDEPDYEFYLNVERFMGKELTVSVDPDMELRLQQSDSGVEGPQAYCGKYRPAAHFTAKRGWLNDPNGLVRYRGKYLMFYQHNPVACTWENMHWGYAVSTDLMHWEERDIALYPDQDGTMFSGSALIDERNVTGLKENENDVILLFYTCAGSTSETAKGKPFTQCLAYSTDGGETFRKYARNPLISQIVPGNRDPKVLYYPPTDTYHMALYLDNHEYAFFVSRNLLDWTLTQKISLPDDSECPDFYPLPVDGDSSRIKWVLIGASDRYYIGDFDGKRFCPTARLQSLNYGNSSYAAQSWSNVADGRRIRTSCASVTIPGMPFGSCMSIPQELSLRTVDGALRLCAAPVPEIRALYGESASAKGIELQEGDAWTAQTSHRAYDIDLRIHFQDNSRWEVSLFGLTVTFDAARQELTCLDRAARVSCGGNMLELRMLLDTVYAEIFAGPGDVFMGMSYLQDRNLNRLRVKVLQGTGVIEKIELVQLREFWS